MWTKSCSRWARPSKCDPPRCSQMLYTHSMTNRRTFLCGTAALLWRTPDESPRTAYFSEDAASANKTCISSRLDQWYAATLLTFALRGCEDYNAQLEVEIGLFLDRCLELLTAPGRQSSLLYLSRDDMDHSFGLLAALRNQNQAELVISAALLLASMRLFLPCCSIATLGTTELVDSFPCRHPMVMARLAHVAQSMESSKLDAALNRWEQESLNNPWSTHRFLLRGSVMQLREMSPAEFARLRF